MNACVPAWSTVPASRVPSDVLHMFTGPMSRHIEGYGMNDERRAGMGLWHTEYILDNLYHRHYVPVNITTVKPMVDLFYIHIIINLNNGENMVLIILADFLAASDLIYFNATFKNISDKSWRFYFWGRYCIIFRWFIICHLIYNFVSFVFCLSCHIWTISSNWYITFVFT